MNSAVVRGLIIMGVACVWGVLMTLIIPNIVIAIIFGGIGGGLIGWYGASWVFEAIHSQG